MLPMLPIFDRLAEGTGGNFAQGRRFEVENGHQKPDNGQGSPSGADCPRSLWARREDSMNEQQPLLQEALAVLAAEANRADAEAVWPGRSWEALCRVGVLEGCVPEAY